MKRLQRLVLVQFFLYDAVELDINGHVAFLGQNGSGKTSLLDAIQIAMLGGHGNYLAFNTQSVGSTGGGKRNPRSIKDYCLGVVDDTGEGGGRFDRKRDSAISYITLIFEDDATHEQVSIGICIRANAEESDHEVLGLYVLQGVGLTLADHLEQANGEDVPLLWNDFVAAARSRLGKTDKTPYFTTQPTKYIQEMIHALQPKAKSIDVREYLKVFNKSVLLRNIDSVDSFVRDYVVEPQSIDRRRAKSQIERFKELSLLVEQVRKQIADLAEISIAYEEVEKYTVRSASIKALAAMYAHEEHKEALNILEGEIHNNSRRRRLCKEASKNHERNVKVALDARDAARDAWTSKPGADSINAHAMTKATNERYLEATRLRIERDLSLVSGVIDRLSTLKAIPSHQRKLKEIDQALSHHSNRFNQGLMTDIDLVIADAIQFLSSEVEAYKNALKDAEAKHSKASQHRSTISGQMINSKSGGAPISDAVALVIERLHREGIKAEPVCNIVEIKDEAWQPAIEAFLKSNREALVIADGREREAVRLIRSMPERDNPFAAKVVQPYHLRDQRWNESDNSLVGNLLASENPIALSYLRSVFGGMKCVETEEELEQYSRALTIDGMLSANFTTSRLRFFPTEKLLFGKRITYAEQRSWESKLEAALDAEQKAEQEKNAIALAIDRISKMGDLGMITARVKENVEQALEEQKAVNDVVELIQNINTAEIKPLKEAFDAKQRELEAVQLKQRENENLLTSTNATLRGQFPVRSSLRKKRDEAAAALELILSAKDEIDESIIERVRGEIEATIGLGGYPERAVTCQRRVNVADRAAEEALIMAIQPFQRYLDQHGVALGEELKQWRLGKAWVKSEHERLEKTELVHRADDVRRARDAAEEAFRNDVAVRIRESIEQMRVTISDINKALSTSPPFSNGERYRFIWSPAEAHKPIYDYIMNVGKGSERDMFTLGDDAHTDIMKLLDDTTQDGKDRANPLDDYRTLFTFDLMIDREGKKSIPLSRRLGVGSNGEHRTPFYVIAGAAMAAAYRIDSGKHTGAGLMLLDEAFHGMDQQNALSAARFLDSIGLQMVMAAPEADHSKLAPTLDTIYEINRFDKEIFVEQTKIKEPAKALLTSDMPSEHPDLLTRMIETIEASSA